MAPLQESCLKKLLLLYLLFLLFITSTFISAHQKNQPRDHQISGRKRVLLELEDEEDEPIIKKKSTSKISNSANNLEDEEDEPIIKKKSSSKKNLKDEEDEPIIKKKSSSKSSNSAKNLEDEEDEPIIKKKSSYKSSNSAKNLEDEEDEPIIKKKSSSKISNSSKSQTKLIKPTSSTFKNQTKLIKSASDSSKNKTKTKTTSSDSSTTPTIKTQFKKLNSTSKSSSNSTTKNGSVLTKKSSDLPKNKTTKPNTSKETKSQLEKDFNKPNSNKDEPQKKAQKQPTWIEEEEDDDLVSEIRDLPSKFQETIVPDLERISKTSKVYLTKYNKEFTKGFKPYVGNKYAPAIASLASFAFIVIPLILVSLIFNRIKAYFSLQKLLIFIQVYLAIYFSILCLSSLLTGLEPLKFFFATSRSTYICVQVLQTLAYLLYLLLLLMYLILVFSTETGPATKFLGLAQTFVGFAVGLHYYMTVFHRAVLRQPPKTSWKVHALYATCFLVICLLVRFDRRKKAYVEEGGEEGKKN